MTLTSPLARLADRSNVRLSLLIPIQGRSVFRPAGSRRTPSEEVNSGAEPAVPHNAATPVMLETAAGVTVSVVVPLTLPEVAVMVVGPVVNADARPVDEIVATVTFDETQAVEAVRFCVVPSV